MTDIAKTAAGTGDDYHLPSGFQALILRIDGRVDITMHAIGELEWGCELIGINRTLGHSEWK